MDLRNREEVCEACGGKPPHCCDLAREGARIRAAVEEAMPPIPLDVYDKVYVQEEVKLFRCSTVLGYFDSKVYGMMGADVSAQNPVPVHDQANKRIGYAVVEIRQGSNTRFLHADITIDYATEERLLIQNGDKLWAYCFGSLKIDPKALQVFDLQKPLPVQVLRVDGVQLLRRPHWDKRVDPLRESM